MQNKVSTRHFCTHFDSNYLPHAMSLHKSLISNHENAILFMVCMDENCFSILSNLQLERVELIKINDIENQFPELVIAKSNRSLVEYFYTCSSVICYYIIKKNSYITEITYLDADLFFFSNPEPIFSELEAASVGIIAHKFSFFTRRNEKYGIYNVGWITFKNDMNGLACLSSWMNKCLDWCYQVVEKERYADQKYLDYWQSEFENVHVIQNKGANLAIWNISNYKITKKNVVYVDNTPLIFYHFANFKQIGPREFKTDLSRVFKSLSGVIKEDIYMPYVRSIINFSNNNSYIKAKKDSHVSGIYAYVRKNAHSIQQFLFPDTIKIK